MPASLLSTLLDPALLISPSAAAFAHSIPYTLDTHVRRFEMSLACAAGSDAKPALGIYVNLAGHGQLLISIPRSSRVTDLQQECLIRAAKLGIKASPSSIVLRTTGDRPALIDGEDLLENIMDLTKDSTFYLEILGPLASQDGSGPSTLSVPLSLGQGSCIYIRWMSAKDTITHPKLEDIPANMTPVNPTISITDLSILAMERLQLEPRFLPGLRLWSKFRPLATTDNVASLGELGLVENKGDPVAIFYYVDLTLGHPSLPDSESLDFEPTTSLGLDATRRGVCTFLTSLKMLLGNMKKDQVQLDTFSDVFLRFTLFPPAILAFAEIHTDGKIDARNVGHVQLLAHVFDILCSLTVPEWNCTSRSSKLEGSRQVFAFIYRRCLEIKLRKPRKNLTRIEVCNTSDGVLHGSDVQGLFGQVEKIQLPQDDDAGPPKEIMVSLETPVCGLAKQLVSAAALHRNTTQSVHTYFQPSKGWKYFTERSRADLPTPHEFDALLSDANIYPAFRMVDPLKLGSCLSAELPVITLSGKGYVSTFGQTTRGCGESSFFLSNIIEGAVKLDNDDPGQTISQELQPVIEARKGTLSWEVDAWSDFLPTAHHGAPDESVIICVDKSGSMNKSMFSGWNTAEDQLGTPASRLHETKEFFCHFTTRLSSYGLPVHVGLITFNGEAVVSQPLTALQLDFCHKLESVKAGGRTAIYDALGLASLTLAQHRETFPATKCRIILLTDGCDCSSDFTPFEVGEFLQDDNIVLDAVVFGSNRTNDLFRLARSTGGYAFNPATQDLFFQIFLLETMVDFRTRPEVEKRLVDSEDDWDEWIPDSGDMKDQFNFPPCRPHASANDIFIELKDASRYFKKRPSPGSQLLSSDNSSDSYPFVTRGQDSDLSGSSGSSGSGSMGSRHILREIQLMLSNEHPNMDVYVSQTNFGVWKVVMQGPPESAYEEGVFLLLVDIGPEFPRMPPSLRFITPTLHPNISKARISLPSFYSHPFLPPWAMLCTRANFSAARSCLPPDL